MDLLKMVRIYHSDGLSLEMSSARVCQDIVLTAISRSTLNNNVTIKGRVVMRSMTNDNRRATRDIDLDFIHYPLNDDAIKVFIEKLNCVDGITITIDGAIEELKHQDYHGRSVKIIIEDDYGTGIRSKIDMGVHKYYELEQEEYLFDVCMNEQGVSLLKNTVEQSFAEKLRSLLILAINSRRYKDIYDMYYLKDTADLERLKKAVKILIFDNGEMRENNYEDIIRRISATFEDSQYLRHVSHSKQRWIDEDIGVITTGILDYLELLKEAE